MSYAGDITLPFGDGEHRFRLRIGELRELQEKCKAGPPVILARLAGNAWNIEDVREPIRLGLIGGGGFTPTEAHRLVTRYVDEGGWLENVLIAHQVLTAAIVGPEDETLGEGQAAEETATNSPTGSSASPPSTKTPGP